MREAGIGKSKAEWIERAVGHIDVAREEALLADGRPGEVDSRGRTPGGELVVIERLLADGAGKAHGQLAAGRDISVENIDDGMAGLGSGEPDFEDGREMLGGPVEHEGTARENEQNDRLAGGGDGFQKLLLVAGQVEMRA